MLVRVERPEVRTAPPLESRAVPEALLWLHSSTLKPNT